MRAPEDGVKNHTIGSKQFAESLTNLASLCLADKAAANARLIAYHDKQKSTSLQFPQRVCRIWEKRDLFRAPHIAMVKNQRAIPVEENSLSCLRIQP